MDTFADRTAGAGSAATLIALDSSFAYREYRIGPAPTTVGRDACRCGIVAAGATISREHLRISGDAAGQFVLEDLRSTNGVFVNGWKVVDRVALADGDLIGLGVATSPHLRFSAAGFPGNAREMRCPPGERWVIGRTEDCDISLAFEPTVSSRHAFLIKRGGQLRIVDNRSLNGTWINGERIGKGIVGPDDTVVVGTSRFRFQLEADGSLWARMLERSNDVRLECVGLTCKSPGRGADAKTLIDHLTLSLRPGEFVGILGPSGAGKTTLLTALNGFRNPERGQVLFNQTPLDESGAMFRNAIGYVPQEDILHAELTVEKSLAYIARLRLSPDLTADQRANIVDATLETLGLQHVRNQRIDELSGGQRKRVSIGAELIVRPRILFLDEPTAGLDPNVEERLMHHFHAMARGGTTVIITTHLLSNLALLDRLIIVACGRLVFFGKPDEALAFFGEEARPLQRPAEIFTLLDSGETAGGRGEAASIREEKAAFYAERYLKSAFFEDNVSRLLSPVARNMLASGDRQAITLHQQGSNSSRTGWWAMPATRSGRRVRSLGAWSMRSWMTLAERHLAIRCTSRKRLGLYFLLPLILALVTLSQNMRGLVPAETEKEEKRVMHEEILRGGPRLENGLKALLIQPGAEDSRSAAELFYAMRFEGVANLPVPLSVVLMIVMTGVFSGTVMACLEISGEQTIFRRERMSNLAIHVYLGSKLPFLLMTTALQCLVFLGICFIHPVLRQAAFLPIWLSMVAVAWASVALGLFLSAIDPSSGRFSVLLAIVAVLPQLILSGGLGPDFYQGMPSAVRWAADLLPARWGLEMQLTALYGGFRPEPVSWMAGLVRHVIGFDYGTRVYYTGGIILMAQALFWLSCSAWHLKRRDYR